MYKTRTKLRHERETLIANAISSSERSQTFYEFQNTRTELPIVRLDVSLPIYRLENYRTRTAQLRYIRDHNAAVDFFLAGQENDSTQQAQHEILARFAQRGKSYSVAPIMTELQAEEQREPLLLSRIGVVVNGNRRLAAMRELWTSDPQTYRRFRYVDCAVLPENITPEETRDIEVRLQMRPETKLPYGWIEESIAIKEMLDSGKTPDHVGGLMKKKRKDVMRAARALTEVDIYLKEWTQEPQGYESVEGAEQFFNDLAKALDGVEGEILETKRRIAWALFSNSKNLSRRIYDYNFSFDKKTDEVVKVLTDRLAIDLSTSSTTSDSEDENEILDVELGDEENDSGTTLEPLIEAFDNPSHREEVADELIHVCNTIHEQTRQGEIGNQALNAIKAANTKLMSVDLLNADPKTYPSILAQLTSLKKAVDSLRARVHRMKKD